MGQGATSGKKKNPIEQIKAPILLKTVSAVKRKVNLSVLKDDFSSRTDPSIFKSIVPELLDQSDELSWVFPGFKTSYFLPDHT